MDDFKFYNQLDDEYRRVTELIARERVKMKLKKQNDGVGGVKIPHKENIKQLKSRQVNINKAIHQNFPDGPPSPVLGSLPAPKKKKSRHVPKGTVDDPIVLSDDPIDLSTHDYPVKNLSSVNRFSDVYPIDLSCYDKREHLPSQLNHLISNAKNKKELLKLYNQIQMGTDSEEGVCAGIAQSFLRQLKVPVEDIVSAQASTSSIIPYDYKKLNLGKKLGTYVNNGNFRYINQAGEDESVSGIPEMAEKLREELNGKRVMLVYTGKNHGDTFCHAIQYDSAEDEAYDPNEEESNTLLNALSNSGDVIAIEAFALKPEHDVLEKDKLYDSHPDLNFGNGKRNKRHK